MSFVRALPVRMPAVCALVAALAATLLLVSVPRALAAEVPVAHWTLESFAAPTNMPLQGEGEIDVVAADLGAAEVDGEAQPVTIVDTLPAGIEVIASNPASGEGVPRLTVGGFTCSEPTVHEVVCTFPRKLPSYGQLDVRIPVDVNVAGASELENQVTVSGGELPSASLARAVAVNGEPTAFGVERDALTPENEDGAPDTQAGSHPFQLTSTFDLNRTFSLVSEGVLEPTSPALAKELRFKLPPGLIGNPTVIPQCSDEDFGTQEGGEEWNVNQCPNDTAVGVATISYTEPLILGFNTETAPLFNLVPSPGEPAAFGFEVHNVPVVLATSVRTGEDYGVTVSVRDTDEAIDFISSRVTFWGVPGAASHDNTRGWACLGLYNAEEKAESPCTPSSEAQPPAFLMLPTSCAGPLSTSVAVNAWNEAEPVPALSFSLGEAMDGQNGCNHLPFSAEIKVSPDIQSASSPTGLTVGVHVPQEVSLNANVPGAANVKDTTVTLPEGVTLNPAGANNLEACLESQIGYEGFRELNPSGESGVRTAQFTSGEPSCPNASKIATATIHTPLLPNPLEGEVYLAAQNANPFGSLVAMYLVARDPVSGVLVKLPGEVSLNQQTGQITTTFDQTPQLPFEELELHFFGGERAPLATPAHCGTYTTDATFTPWSGNEAVNSTSSFEVTSGPNGSACPGALLPFVPTFAGGTINNQGGSFSSLSTTIGREDGSQNLQAVTLHYPAGLSGLLKGVALCPEAQADAGTCGPESEIGETIVSVGLGGDPYTVTGGKVFLTEKYEGAPFGLSIVNPAVAGPYNLGTVVVRAKVEVNPITAALTITTDPSGPYAIPHILDGIPLEIKHINVTVNRPGFIFNPTNCEKTAITGAMSSAEGASSAIDVPFQVANCASMKFKPAFSASTSGKTSRRDGASLKVKIAYPKEAFGSEANIKEAKVELPEALPSRLSTLQKACLAATFEANPAGCPAESIVGHAKAITPLLPVPLEGPAYFVSYGGAKFPELVMVLQGYGVTIDLHGETFISKKGVTSSTFKTVPDQPVESFELTLPEGRYSALGANKNLCHAKLRMPTLFVGQNGAQLKQDTKIAVSGCPDEVSIDSHKVKKGTLSLKVSVPAAGKLTASGKGLTSKTKKASGRETLTLELKERKKGRLKSKVKLVFKPKTGKKLTKTLSVKLR